MSGRTTRRTFIRQIAGAGLGLPAVWPRLARAVSANEKLDIAIVGAANQARFSIDNLRGENLVAFADVDGRFLARAAADFPPAGAYSDYRRMLDRRQAGIDAVVVATPDHHHAQAALRALALGKHVYCEKPLAHTIEEVRLMSEAASRNGVATQMGTQIHAEDHYRRMVELVRSGAIGAVREVHIWQDGFHSGPPIPDRPDPVPDYLDWDLWLGPAPRRDYHPKIYHPIQWRGWWDFGGGVLSDIGCHVFDLAHWALGLGRPRAATARGRAPMPQRAPRSLIVEYEYPASGAANGGGPVKLIWYHGSAHVDWVDVRAAFSVPARWRSARNILFLGERGKLLTDYERHVLLPEERFAGFEPPAPTLAPSPGHHAEWVAACKGGPPPLCRFDYAGPLTESVLLGLVAHRAGNVRIEFDAAAMRITNHPDANAYLTKPYRPGWEIEKLV